MSAEIESPEDMAARIYPAPKSAPTAGHKARAIAERAIREDRKQIVAAMIAVASEYDEAADAALDAGERDAEADSVAARDALRAFAARIGASR